MASGGSDTRSLSSDSGGSDSEDSVASDALVKNIPKRATRGYRSRALVGEVAQADEEFWGQKAFTGEDSDSAFSSIPASSDSSDSDIDDPEPDEAANAVAARAAAASARAAAVMMGEGTKRNVYVDPALKRRRAAAKRAAAKASGGAGAAPPSAAPAGGGTSTPTTLAGVRSRRSSTVEATQTATARAEDREAAATAASATASVATAAQPRRSQEEVLADAAETTLMNLLALAKGRGGGDAQAGTRGRAGHRAVAQGRRVVWRARRGEASTLTFRGVDAVPSTINASAPPEPPRKVCAVSGAPASLRDPVSWLPYAGKEHFAPLRRALAEGRLQPDAASPMGRGRVHLNPDGSFRVVPQQPRVGGGVSRAAAAAKPAAAPLKPGQHPPSPAKKVGGRKRGRRR